jgi:hypothetical protein
MQRSNLQVGRRGLGPHAALPIGTSWQSLGEFAHEPQLPQAREAWAAIHGSEGEPDEWDFSRISSFSSRLNRQIRKRGVAKIGSRFVLRGALAPRERGVSLGPYVPGKDAFAVVQ